MAPQDTLAEQKMVLDSVEGLVRTVVAPRASEIDATAEFPRDLYKAAAEIGLFGAYVPVQYGGIEFDLTTMLAVTERIARSSATCALIISNCDDGTMPIVLGASDEIKREVLPPIASGEAIPCFALTEAGAGSDAAALQATARRVGDHYVLTGEKLYVSNGSVGDWFCVWAKAEGGITAFLVPRDLEGLEIGRDEDLLGLRGMPATTVRFEEAPVDVAFRLGAEGEGMSLAMATLDHARLNISAIALGTARGALEVALEHARNRETFGQPIIQHQGLNFLLADVVTEVAAAKALYEQAIAAIVNDGSRRASVICAMAKIVCTAAAMRATTEAVQVLGGIGLTRDVPVERMFRDAKTFQILDGTTQIQQLIVGRYLVREGLPI